MISHTYGDRFSLGEPDASRSERAETLSRLLIAAGLKAPVRPRLRDELWVKLWGNMAFNPISALTTATLDVITGDPGARAVARAMMLEGQAAAEAVGVRFALDVDKRIQGGAEVGRHKTSMLQDLKLGRPLGDRGASRRRGGTSRLGRGAGADQHGDLGARAMPRGDAACRGMRSACRGQAFLRPGPASCIALR